MIYAIVGRPRNGKSYESVVYHILPALKAGRRVITNIPLNLDKLREVFGDKVDSLVRVVDGRLEEYGQLRRPFSIYTDYLDDWRDENNLGPLYVIDEAHMVLPRNANDPKILEFYSLHGHYGIDIILVTQNLRKIHRDIKDMIEMTFYCAKNTAMGSDKTYTKKVKLAASNETVNEEQRTYKSVYFSFYQSHTMSKGSVVEQMAQDIKPVWKSWNNLFGVVFILGGIIALVVIFSGGDSDDVDLNSSVVVSENSSPSNDKTSSSSESSEPSNSPDVGFGPLDGFDLFVSGYSRQVAYSSRGGSTGEINRGLTFFKIYLDVYLRDKKLFTVNNIDLSDMGYSFEALSDCIYRVNFGLISKFVVCAKPDDVKSSSNASVVPVPDFSL